MSFSESKALMFFSLRQLCAGRGGRGTVAVEYAVAAGTLALAITVAFTGLGARLVQALAALPV